MYCIVKYFFCYIRKTPEQAGRGAANGYNFGMSHMTTLGKRLLLSRRDLRLNQEELSEISGVSRQYISDIERGRAKNVGVEVVFALAKALGVSVEYLLGLTDVPLPEESESVLREDRVVYEVGDARERALLQELVEVFQELDEEERRLLLDLARRLRRADEARTVG